MTLSQLFDILDVSGTRLTLSGDKLRVDAPKGAMTAEIRAGLAEHREAILASLVNPQSNGAPITGVVAFELSAPATSPESLPLIGPTSPILLVRGPFLLPTYVPAREIPDEAVERLEGSAWRQIPDHWRSMSVRK